MAQIAPAATARVCLSPVYEALLRYLPKEDGAGGPSTFDFPLGECILGAFCAMALAAPDVLPGLCGIAKKKAFTGQVQW
jgi:hypothetical protein